MLEKVRYSEHPPRHDYRLTDKGRDLWPILTAMRQWGDRYAAPAGPPLQVTHRTCGHVSDAVMVCSACGERLGARTFAPLRAPVRSNPLSGQRRHERHRATGGPQRIQQGERATARRDRPLRGGGRPGLDDRRKTQRWLPSGHAGTSGNVHRHAPGRHRGERALPPFTGPGSDRHRDRDPANRALRLPGAGPDDPGRGRLRRSAYHGLTFGRGHPPSTGTPGCPR